MQHDFIINGYPERAARASPACCLKPWDERDAQPEAGAGGAGAEIPRGAGRRRCRPFRRRRCRARPAARRCSSSSAPPATTTTLADVAQKMQQAAKESGLFLFTDVDLKFDTPQYRVQGRRRQGQPHRRQHGRRRHCAGDHARRQLRQPVQPLRPQLSGDPAGAARIPSDAGMADALPVARRQRRTRAAVGGGERHPRRCSPTR